MASEKFIPALKEEVSRLLVELKNADPDNDEQFTSLVRNTINSLGSDDVANVKEFARAVDVALGTARRYVSGDSRPHPAMRPHIYKGMIKLIEKVWGEMLKEP